MAEQWGSGAGRGRNPGDGSGDGQWNGVGGDGPGGGAGNPGGGAGQGPQGRPPPARTNSQIARSNTTNRIMGGIRRELDQQNQNPEQAGTFYTQGEIHKYDPETGVYTGMISGRQIQPEYDALQAYNPDAPEAPPVEEESGFTAAEIAQGISDDYGGGNDYFDGINGNDQPDVSIDPTTGQPTGDTITNGPDYSGGYTPGGSLISGTPNWGGIANNFLSFVGLGPVGAAVNYEDMWNEGVDSEMSEDSVHGAVGAANYANDSVDPRTGTIGNPADTLGSYASPGGIAAVKAEADAMEAKRQADQQAAERAAEQARDAAREKAARDAARMEAAREASRQAEADRKAASDRAEAARAASAARTRAEDAREASRRAEAARAKAAKAKRDRGGGRDGNGGMASDSHGNSGATAGGDVGDGTRGGGGGRGGGGNGGGGGGNGGGGGDGSGCFAKGTLFRMADDSYKQVEDIKVGDEIHGGTVLKLRDGPTKRDFYDYNGTIMTDEHFVLEDGTWKYVFEADRSELVEGYDHYYTMDTTNHRLYGINDEVFTDDAVFDEDHPVHKKPYTKATWDEMLELLNSKSVQKAA